MAQKTPIWQFKAYQNWVKTILISELVESNETVAEFCCGTGLETGKWERSKIKKYYGFDHSQESLAEAESKWKQKSCPYDAEFIKLQLTTERIEHFINNNSSHTSGSNTTKSITGGGSPDSLFDVVSCFDGMQNAFIDYDHANTFIKNASSRLKVGGFFFGIIPDSSSIWYKSQKVTSGLPCVKSSLFSIEFDSEIFNFFGCKYNLSMKDGSKIQENLIHFPSFINLCKSHDLVLVEATNLNDFYEENKKNYESKLKQCGVMVGKNKIDPAQMELISLYTTFIFVKEVKEPKAIDMN
ncbi:hypothetical protein CYY_007042 [Polysphondylium violaceum]|uniref:mRNA (guanine-N(7))-methyltransferase n=1 Tax=Polysphondylium violaceum TaxID=133409 RepID=A0A8J4PQ53_9MYCE|nr:hypothetical protein CYY_007042 [Polysphondylium violaceum]